MRHNMIQKKQKDEASDENCQAWYDKQKKATEWWGIKWK